jgi:CHAD domain-containing protein
MLKYGRLKNRISASLFSPETLIPFGRRHDCMPIDPQICSATLKKLDKQLAKLGKKPSSASIHKFRTYSRRIETWFQELIPEPDRKEKKLMKSLRRLRKKAGKVRDLEVQLNLLANLHTPQEPGRKIQLLCVMRNEHELRQKKFLKALRSDSIRQVRKRLQHTLLVSGLRTKADPVQTAKQMFGQISRSQLPLTETRLHQFRIIGKRARYIAELAGDQPEAKYLVGELKHMQDVIGDWHDWLQLTVRAEELFSEARDSSLLAVLRNLTRAKFRQGVEILAATRANLVDKPVTLPAARKIPVSIMQNKTAVA